MYFESLISESMGNEDMYGNKDEIKMLIDCIFINILSNPLISHVSHLIIIVNKNKMLTKCQSQLL